jgi:hypothetical protein
MSAPNDKTNEQLDSEELLEYSHVEFFDEKVIFQLFNNLKHVLILLPNTTVFRLISKITRVTTMTRKIRGYPLKLV